MANAFTCISKKPVSKHLKAAVKQAEATFRSLFPAETDSQIAGRVYTALKQSVTDRERAILAQVEKQLKLEEQVVNAIDPKTFKPFTAKRQAERLLAVIEGSDNRQHADVTSVHGLWDANRGILHARIRRALQEFSRRVWTPGMSRSKTLQGEVSRGLWTGQRVDPAARHIADAYKDNIKFYHDYMNANGVRLFYDPDKAPLIVHIARKVGAVPRSAWVNFIWDKLDRANMVDDTGVPYTDAALRTLLEEKYDFIKTHGISQLKPGEPGHIPFWKRLDDSSFLSWKDYDSWKAYNDKFGYDDFFSAMIAHTDQMARNMAIVGVMGPDPNSAFRYLTDLGKISASAIGKEETKVTDQLRYAYDIATGEAGKPYSAFWAERSADLRNVTHSAVLGGLTPLAFMSDNVTAYHGRKLNGIAHRLGLVKMMTDWVALSARGPKSKRIEEALAIGFDLQSIRAGVLGAMRGVGDFDGHKWSHIVADTNFRVTGLTSVTDAIQSSFISDFIRDLQRNLGRPFKDFSSERLTQTLWTYGIEEADWLRLSKNARFINVRGIDRLSFAEMARSGSYDDATKLLAMVNKEVETRATITATPKTRRVLRGGTKAGSFQGEFMRFGTDLLSWPVTFLWSNLGARLQDRWMSAGGKAASLVSLFVAMSLAGAAIVQFRQVANGKDIYDWKDPQFWLEALAIGGGFGILGDLFFREHYGPADSALLSFLGPSIGTISQAAYVPFDILRGFFTGQPSNPGREAVSFLRRTLPFSSLWYGKVAIDRMIFDELSIWLDPNAYTLFRERTRAPARERGQSFWWPPGLPGPTGTPGQAQFPR